MSPGRNPKSLLLRGIMGRARKIWRKSFIFSSAEASANSVLPVPAFPDKVTSWILLSVNTFSANDCSAFLGRTPYEFFSLS